MPKVSIIVPCYGVEKYLDRCMKSLVSQTLQDIEIILVDDVSPDKVPQMCDDWAKADDRIKVVHKERNEGLGYARNTGLRYATGEYVAFIDSDDFVDFAMFQDLYSHASKNSLDACFCGFYFYKDEANQRKRQEKADYEICDTKESVRNVLLDMVGSKPDAVSDVAILSSVWKGIYRREVLVVNNIRFVSEREYIAEDIIFHCDFLPYCNKVGFVPGCHYYYCSNGSSLTKSYKVNRFVKELFMYDSIETRLKKQGFVEKEYRDRLDRYFQLKVRACIAQQAHFIKEKGYINMRKVAKEIIDDKRVRLFVHRFPFRQLHIKHRIFFLLLKYKLVDLLLLILR